jgi:hypothetical protein
VPRCAAPTQWSDGGLHSPIVHYSYLLWGYYGRGSDDAMSACLPVLNSSPWFLGDVLKKVEPRRILGEFTVYVSLPLGAPGASSQGDGTAVSEHTERDLCRSALTRRGSLSWVTHYQKRAVVIDAICGLLTGMAALVGRFPGQTRVLYIAVTFTAGNRGSRFSC